MPRLNTYLFLLAPLTSSVAFPGVAFADTPDTAANATYTGRDFDDSAMQLNPGGRTLAHRF